MGGTLAPQTLPLFRRALRWGRFQRGDDVGRQIRAIIGAPNRAHFNQASDVGFARSEIQLDGEVRRRGGINRAHQRGGQMHRPVGGEIRRPTGVVARIEHADRGVLRLPRTGRDAGDFFELVQIHLIARHGIDGRGDGREFERTLLRGLRRRSDFLRGLLFRGGRAGRRALGRTEAPAAQRGVGHRMHHEAQPRDRPRVFRQLRKDIEGAHVARILQAHASFGRNIEAHRAVRCRNFNSLERKHAQILPPLGLPRLFALFPRGEHRVVATGEFRLERGNLVAQDRLFAGF